MTIQTSRTAELRHVSKRQRSLLLLLLLLVVVVLLVLLVLLDLRHCHFSSLDHWGASSHEVV